MTTRTIYGKRIGKQGTIRLGCSAILFNSDRKMVLLTRRMDNGMWCLPGGAIDPGESVAEGCEREFFEETGLKVKVIRLTGVYSDPDQLIVYPDENKVQIVALNFEVRMTGGQISLSHETSDIRYFPTDEAVKMDLFHSHVLRIIDALTGEIGAFIH
jgi:ADP-ribose pyrophosphatase YjhB (NUDIX family)